MDNHVVDICLAIFALSMVALAVIPHPEGTPIPSAPLTKPLSKTAAVVLKYNNEHPFFSKAPVWTEPAPGVTIHKIPPSTAQEEADVAEAASVREKYPLTMIFAALGVESVLDPLCENHNAAPGESNEGNKFGPAGWDMGLGQFKLGILAKALGITLAQAQELAFTIKWAIDYHVAVMKKEVAWANTVIAQNQGNSNVDYRFRDPYLLATCSYNYGRNGVLEQYYYKGTFPDGGKNPDGTPRKNHGASVMSDEAYFAKQLGVTSIFAYLKA